LSIKLNSFLSSFVKAFESTPLFLLPSDYSYSLIYSNETI